MCAALARDVADEAEDSLDDEAVREFLRRVLRLRDRDEYDPVAAARGVLLPWMKTRKMTRPV